jgi:2-phospho-L-lactate guanylyltransferase
VHTAAVLPVKRFSRAKQRLSASVADPLRRDLARAMVADVLDALALSDAIAFTVVVTAEPEAAGAARARGALVVEDAAESGQSAAAALGLRSALAHGAERVLCVPGDCPALDPRELDGLLAGGSAREVVIVPDRHGTGTNGLLLAPPDVMTPAFGPDSCARHAALARAAGVECRLETPPSLLLDIDTGADLAALRELLAGLAGGAARTRAALLGDERASIDTAA